MTKLPFAIYFLIMLVLLRSDIAIAAQPDHSHQLGRGSKIDSVLKIQKKHNSFSVDYVLQRKDRASTKKRAIIKVPTETAQSQFFDAAAIPIFNDAVSAVEVTGACGNKVCEKLIFRFNDSLMAYHLFFRGGYSSVSIFDEHLVEAGSSGCCAFEYRAYKIPENGRAISGSPQIVIEVKNIPESTSADEVECAFTDAAGGKIVPPNHDWLEFCKIYGESYRLRK